MVPVWEAQNSGYVSVGLHVDSEDWQRPGVPAIVNNVLSRIASAPPNCDDTVENQCSRNIVLLHDSGGDRSQTIAALPIIIDTLRAHGYRFVPVSELAGISRDAGDAAAVAPDAAAARIDFGLFERSAFSSAPLGYLFAMAITLGIARAVALTGLALVAMARERRRRTPRDRPRAHSSAVLIPAFNEERVIERSVRQVLASTDVVRRGDRHRRRLEGPHVGDRRAGVRRRRACAC